MLFCHPTTDVAGVAALSASNCNHVRGPLESLIILNAGPTGVPHAAPIALSHHSTSTIGKPEFGERINFAGSVRLGFESIASVSVRPCWSMNCASTPFCFFGM